MYSTFVLVDVVPMRARGVKLDRDDLLQRAPVRGRLALWKYHDGFRRKDIPVASLSVTTYACSGHLLPCFGDVRITHRLDGQLALVGMEQIARAKTQVDPFRQPGGCVS